MKKLTLDAGLYRTNVKSIEELLRDKTPQERYDFIGNLALITNVPIIIVACYVGELYGFNPQLNAFIERMKEFYSVGDVFNVQEDTTSQS